MRNGVSRGERAKGEDLQLKVPSPGPKEPGAKTDRQSGKPFSHPRYWSAFILIGDPN
jgi:CHAT domain-containing protein